MFVPEMLFNKCSNLRCETLLSQFLRNIRNDQSGGKTGIDMLTMINILIGHAQSNNELIQVCLLILLIKRVVLSKTLCLFSLQQYHGLKNLYRYLV